MIWPLTTVSHVPAPIGIVPLHPAQDARLRATELAGALRTLSDELAKIAVERRRPVADVERERQVAQQTVDDCQQAADEAKRRRAMLESQRQTYLEREKDQGAAAKEFSYYDRLARAYGLSGLQARVIQSAQAMIRTHASTTLAHLSNGGWQIELQENADGTELEILARDLNQPGAPLRTFDYLSGGEKFRVAISLAVAIGQSVSGGRTVDTLIIDEGFGALDEVNRTLLVSELRRLSEEVLQGGRVIVVSHEDDICEEFGSRYRIAKDGAGLVTVERNGTCVGQELA